MKHPDAIVIPPGLAKLMQLNWSDKVVLALLMQEAGKNGGICTLSNIELTEITGISGIHLPMNRLEIYGFIQRRMVPSSGKQGIHRQTTITEKAVKIMENNDVKINISP